MWKRNGLTGCLRSRWRSGQVVGASRAQPGTGRARTHADRFLALPGYWALRQRHVRELGERIPADGDVRSADGQPAPARFGRIAAAGPRAGTESHRTRTHAWPVRRGGLWKVLYGHSLAIAFGLLFLFSFTLHALGSWRAEEAEQQLKGLPPPGFVSTSPAAHSGSNPCRTGKASSVLSLVVLTIFLRQKDSPQSAGRGAARQEIEPWQMIRRRPC